MPEQWQIVFFRRHRDDDPDERRPGREFLGGCPKKVAAKLIAIIDAVVAAPPPQFSGGGMWEAMHGEMAGVEPDLDHYPWRVIEASRYSVQCCGLPEYPSLGDQYRQRVPRSVG